MLICLPTTTEHQNKHASRTALNNPDNHQLPMCTAKGYELLPMSRKCQCQSSQNLKARLGSQAFLWGHQSCLISRPRATCRPFLYFNRPLTTIEFRGWNHRRPIQCNARCAQPAAEDDLQSRKKTCCVRERDQLNYLTDDKVENYNIYRDEIYSLYVAGWNFFLLLLNCSAWPCLGPA